ncbi:MAG: hypothetical protein CVU43_04660 [Chloroflexi bacterium HGW-Chloroflexi-5]|jgi:hypothetical protein|nr:MAG: hypothetical protein CVU43_04660 [Chloroflexi bacterium HGW-Chloroflexi-5]
MTAEMIMNGTEIFEDDGVKVFISFLHAVWKAKAGDVDLQHCFESLRLDYNMNPLALFGLLMSRKPLSVDQASTLKKVLEMGED